MSTEIIPNNEVANRAYHLWEHAGRPDGRDLEFWIQAEADVRAAVGAKEGDSGVVSARGPLQGVPPNRAGEKPSAESQRRTKQWAESTPRRGASRAR
jgi:hypothetical protein